MSISKQQLVHMLTGGANAMIGASQELTEIDSKFGDADHGITMVKVGQAILSAVEDSESGASIKSLLDDAACNVLMINGGSAIPLWNTLLDGMQEAAPDAAEMTEQQFKEVFRSGLDTLSELSGAKVGDKTLMDTLIPAVEALEGAPDELDAMLTAAEAAAIQGAEATKNFVSKFGRARSYKEATIGTPDAGAVSMKYFFIGLKCG